MRKILVLLSFFTASYNLIAQSVGVGTSSPNASSQLDITATSKGLLIPRMSTSSVMSISNPAKGLMVYDTSKNQLMVNMGTSASPNWQTIVANSGWGLNGNDGTNSSNFIGTTNNQPLQFRINNQPAGIIDSATYNTYFGYGSGVNNSGTQNTGIGYQSLNANQGYNNTADGYLALYSNTTGRANTSGGAISLYSNITGSYNTANGFEALSNNTTADYNTAIGFEALFKSTEGYDNTANGSGALVNNTTGSFNTAIGYAALRNTTASLYNTAVGFNAGSSYDNGYNNVFVGANTDVIGDGFYNVIAIGQGTLAGGSSVAILGNSATAYYKCFASWTVISDGRFKKNIKENVPGLSFILKLKPVTYNLQAKALDEYMHKNIKTKNSLGTFASSKQEPDFRQSEHYQKALIEKEKITYTGFVAQDVEKAANDLGFDFSGVDKPKNENDYYGLRYSEFVVPLVKAVQEQQEIIQTQNKKIDDLQTQINELKSLIKK